MSMKNLNAMVLIISSFRILSLDIKKLLVQFTKQLSFKVTCKGHGIITYLNHASTKDVINTQNQCQFWPYINLMNACCVQLKIINSEIM